MDTMARREFLLAGVAASVLLHSRSGWAQAPGKSPGSEIVPFTFHASDAALADLKRRLEGARWPEQQPVAGWEQGVPLDALRGLVDHWRTRYDWRKCETAMNRFPQFKTRIDGLGIHFAHIRSRHRGALPLSERSAGGAQLGAAGLSQPVLLERTRSRRPLCPARSTRSVRR